MRVLKIVIICSILICVNLGSQTVPLNTEYGILDQFLSYSISGNVQGLKRILSLNNYTDFINQGDYQGHTALMLAARDGNKDIVRLLLSKNINVNLSCVHGRTALMYAADGGSLDIVNYLLAKNADVNIQVGNGTTALLQASGRGYTAIVSSLLKANANANISGIYSAGGIEVFPDMTPLMIAAYNNNVVVVELLIESSKNINQINEYGASAILYAIGRKNTEVAFTLLTAGADVNIAGVYGVYGNITPLALASINGMEDIISSLLIAKANVNYKMMDGKTALMWAAINGDNLIINKLIKAKAELNIQDSLGKTALMYAAENGNYEAVESLLEHNSFINVIDNNNRTALMYALDNGNIDMINLLTKSSLSFR